MANYKKGSIFVITDENSGGMKPRLQAGTYDATVLYVDDGEYTTKGGETGYYERVTFEIENDGYKYLVKDSFFLTDKAMWRAIKLLRALDVFDDDAKNFNTGLIDEKYIGGKTCTVKLIEEAYTGRDGTERTSLKPVEFYPCTKAAVNLDDFEDVTPVDDDSIPF